MTIAFFGMGLLGANFVRALLRRGETVHVWNRSVEKARALEGDGAKSFDDPAEAARGATRVHLTLSDAAKTCPSYRLRGCTTSRQTAAIASDTADS